MSTLQTAIVQSNLFGDSKGAGFNDLETGRSPLKKSKWSTSHHHEVVGYPASVTINSFNPITKITLRYGSIVSFVFALVASANTHLEF
jgi:hypothetical protein